MGKLLKGSLLIIAALITSTLSGSIFYVSPSGNDTNQGTIDKPFKTIPKAITEAIAGDTIYVMKGIYVSSSTILINSSKSGTFENPYHLYSFPGDTVILDFYPQSFGDRGINLRADYWNIRGIVVKNAGDNGLYIEGEYNTIKNCTFYGNDDSGLQISGGGAHNIIINCDSYNNADPDNEDADGFAAKLDIGPGNEFYGCRAWNNSDDGWDLYESDDSVVIADCWAFRNGYLANNSPSLGDGNGFKVGGNFVAGNHLVRNCLAFDNRKYSYHQNNNTGEVAIYNSLGWDSQQRNFNFYLDVAGPNTLVNNISFNGGSGDKFTNCTMTTNSWQSIDADESDFVSLNKSLATDARQLSGELPSNAFARLAIGSNLIDSGTDVGYPFNGTAPDLGPFETISSVAAFTLNIATTGEGGVWISPAGGIYESGQEVTLIAWNGDGYRFNDWSGDVAGTNDTLIFLMDSDKSVVANFTLKGDVNRDSTRIEAEEMILTSYIFERISAASNGKVIRASSSVSFDKATFTFKGDEHNYLVRVRYLDQVDGAATYKFSVNNSLLATWTGDKASGSTNQFIEKEIKNVSLAPDDRLKIESNREGPEYGRVDCIDLIKSEYIPESIAEIEQAVDNNTLFQNYPNPVDQFTQIDFYLSEASDIQLELFDVKSKQKQIIVNSWYPAGTHQYILNRNDLKSGVYYYRLTTSSGLYIRKMILL